MGGDVVVNLGGNILHLFLQCISFFEVLPAYVTQTLLPSPDNMAILVQKEEFAMGTAGQSEESK